MQAIERRIGRFDHELAVCAIFREEAPFLDEWISFHVGVGVSHFFLYNNFSTDDFRGALAPWIERGLVTLRDWPVPVGQTSAYADCIRRNRFSCRWLALIDVDEFLFSPRKQDIRPILRRYSGRPGVEVWQLFFGSGGHVLRPVAGVIQSFRMRAPPSQTSVKTIVNPRLVYKVGVHQSKFWIGESTDTAGRHATKGLQPVLDLLRINHYWSRSLQDLEDKIGRGDASTAAHRDRDWHLSFERTLNAEPDETIIDRRTIGGDKLSGTIS